MAESGHVDGDIETTIDQAWAAAQDAHRASLAPDEAARLQDRAAATFIDALLSEPLFCPVWDAESSDEESIAPKMVERDARDTLVLFDTEDRLASFAQEPTEYVALPGRAFFRLVAGQNVQIALNPDVAPSETLFRSETVGAIAELADAAEEEIEISADAPLTVLPPDDAPEALLRALLARVAAARSLVAEAWLFTAVQEIEPDALAEEDLDDDPAAMAFEPEEMRQLVIGLVGREPRRPAELQDLASELGRIGAAVSNAPFAVALFEMDDRLLHIARRVGMDVLGDTEGAA